MPLTVCYASETGTAEDVAFKIVSRSEMLGLEVEICSIDEYNVETLPTEQMIVFVCSTTGDGEVPSSMRQFWKFLLRKSLPRNSLEKVKFGIFGLGDSGYDKYNAAARRLNTRLKQLGANELLPIGLGDDQGAFGYLTALDPWMESLFVTLCPMSPVLPQQLDFKLAPSQYNITTVQNCTRDTEGQDVLQRALEGNPPRGYITSTSSPLKATVTRNTRMTTTTWQQNVFHIEMTVPPTVTPSHVAGDVLVVYPSNPQYLVDLAESYFSVEFPEPSSTMIEIQYMSRKNSRKNRLLANQSLPTSPSNSLRCTVRELFTYFLGLSNVPQKSYFEELSRYVTVPDESPSMQQLQIDELEEEREKLIELSSAEGAELYDSYCYKEKRGYMEVLSEFRSLRNGQIPLHRFLELVPPLLPRHYSIASSGHSTLNEIHLCVAEVAYKTPLGRDRKGITSHFLSTRQPGESIYCYIRKGTFPPVPLEAPLLLIGPGTGVAPMRAMMYERISLASARPASTNQPCLTLLLFGCRSQYDDYLYEKDWLNCAENVILNCSGDNTDEVLPPFELKCSSSSQEVVVVTAFSRKGRNAGRRVTHSLHTHREAIWSIIKREESHVLVAGSASTKMPSDVRKALAEVCEVAGGMSSIDSQKFLLRMEKQQRFCVEAWS